jgi:hypothetical protein
MAGLVMPWTQCPRRLAAQWRRCRASLARSSLGYAGIIGLPILAATAAAIRRGQPYHPPPRHPVRFIYGGGGAAVVAVIRSLHRAATRRPLPYLAKVKYYTDHNRRAPRWTDPSIPPEVRARFHRLYPATVQGQSPVDSTLRPSIGTAPPRVDAPRCMPLSMPIMRTTQPRPLRRSCDPLPAPTAWGELQDAARRGAAAAVAKYGNAAVDAEDAAAAVVAAVWERMVSPGTRKPFPFDPVADPDRARRYGYRAGYTTAARECERRGLIGAAVDPATVADPTGTGVPARRAAADVLRMARDRMHGEAVHLLRLIMRGDSLTTAAARMRISMRRARRMVQEVRDMQ